MMLSSIPRARNAILVASLHGLAGCTDYWTQLSAYEQNVLLRFYDQEDINTCHITVDRIRYSDAISGTIGKVEFDDWAGYMFLDEESPPIADDPAKGTPLISTKWTEASRIDLRTPGSDIADYPVRKGITGWIVHGRNDCIDRSETEDRKFILALDNGIPVETGEAA
jgi:hypothetical protein